MTTDNKRRTRSSRSRHGCRTCRIRRVKCDETPGACQRCASTGRRCEGYDLHRLPWGGKKNRIHSGSLLLDQSNNLIAPNLLGRTTDERRSFSFFQACTIPMMNSWFDYELWNHVFLQLSMAEPSIFHAVTAVSALHEKVRATGCIQWSRENRASGHGRFALEQYGRAIAALNKRLASNDPELENTVLVCCYLFIVFELFFGNCDGAYEHLQKGIAIFHDRSIKCRMMSSNNSPISNSLSSSMKHLANQAAYFRKSTLYLSFGRPTQYPDHQEPTIFTTLADAVKARSYILHDLSGFLDSSDYLSIEDTTKSASDLLRWQQYIRVRLNQFQQSLGTLEDSLHTRSEKRDGVLFKPKEQQGIDVLRLHHALFSLQTDLCSTGMWRQDHRESLVGRFREIVERCEDITCSLYEDVDQKEACSRQPSLLMEPGIIEPLHYVCKKCPDQLIVQRAIKVLESWPHREGLWTSRLALRLALEAPSERILSTPDFE